MDLSAFRLAFPEFADEQIYPDPMLDYWASIANVMLPTQRWGMLLTQGTYLFVAHHATLSAKDVHIADEGQIPGQAGGTISSKGIAGISISYDTSGVSFENAGNYNSTRYGRDFWQLAMIIGTGGSYV